MEIINFSELAGNRTYSQTDAALTVGVFDGVHIGHREIIARIVRTGSGLLPVAVTFSANPQNVLFPDRPRQDIITLERKLEILGFLGVAVAVMIDFSIEFSKMSSESFLSALAAAFRIRKMVEGENFHFGIHREAGRSALQRFCAAQGADLETAKTVTYKHARVSSTRLRRAIHAGRIEDVRRMLAGEYTVAVPQAALAGRTPDGLVIARDGLTQATPAKGSFRCRLTAGRTGSEEAVVRMGKERIFVRTNRTLIETLAFEEKLHPDFFQ